jgi:hypothetical protein
VATRRIAVERRDRLIEDAHQLSGTNLDGEDRPNVLGMPKQVRFAPELPRDGQVVALAEDEGRQVVGRRSPGLEEPEAPALRIILVVGSCSRRSAATRCATASVLRPCR